MAKKHPGIVVRHSRGCRTETGGACNCDPSYRAWVYDAASGQKIQQTFRNLSEARGWRSDAASALRKGTLRPTNRMLLSDAAESFIEGLAEGTVLNRKGQPFKPSVRRAYATDLRRFVLPDLGAVAIGEIRRRDVQAFVDRLQAGGQSPARIQAIVMPLRTIYRRAIDRDEVAINPTTNVRLPAVTGTRERVATAGEAVELLDALKVEDQALWATAFYAGLRRGELRGLRWDDVDLTANVISVVRSWDEKEGPVAPKSEKGRRRVPIPGALRKYLLEQKARTGRRDTDLVFGSTATHPFTPTNIRKRALTAWGTANRQREKEKRPKLVPIGLHECRHTYVSLMHDAGLPLEQIGDYIGHSSTYMTDRYRHLLDGHEKTAASRFDSYLAATGPQTGPQAVETA